nr:putative integron gene cassette protein [uncultured bacterium]
MVQLLSLPVLSRRKVRELVWRAEASRWQAHQLVRLGSSHCTGPTAALRTGTGNAVLNSALRRETSSQRCLGWLCARALVG